MIKNAQSQFTSGCVLPKQAQTKKPESNSWDEIIKVRWAIQVLYVPCKVCPLTNTDI